ncbi:MAG TPA: AhpC/TSA family protein [Actinomycetospora sp.]|uniref:AhpC/TSA family protein n=1 Tax=Actinomycetospora sp. TaxID=1872135 RepID=UPI002F42026C
MATEAGRDVPVVAVGFDDAEALGLLADHLGWTSPFLADPDRRLYARLGMRRAPWWRVWSPRTLAFYRRALRRAPVPRPVDPASVDVSQMGGDAVVVDGEAVRRWLPRTPVDRVAPAVLVAAARGERSDGDVNGAQTESM